MRRNPTCFGIPGTGGKIHAGKKNKQDLHTWSGEAGLKSTETHYYMNILGEVFLLGTLSVHLFQLSVGPASVAGLRHGASPWWRFVCISLPLGGGAECAGYSHSEGGLCGGFLGNSQNPAVFSVIAREPPSESNGAI